MSLPTSKAVLGTGDEPRVVGGFRKIEGKADLRIVITTEFHICWCIQGPFDCSLNHCHYFPRNLRNSVWRRGLKILVADRTRGLGRDGCLGRDLRTAARVINSFIHLRNYTEFPSRSPL